MPWLEWIGKQAVINHHNEIKYRLVHEHRTAYNGDPGVAYEYNFAYDAAGNRTAWEEVGVGTTNYTHDAANKTLAAGSSSFTYGIKGNTLTETLGGIVTEYTWDPLNRMIQWEKTNETTEAYLYNADGMRVRKPPSGGTATDFLLDRRQIAEEITGSSIISYVGPLFVSTVNGIVQTIYHPDGIGSTRAMSNENEAVTQVEIYDAYGSRLSSSGPASAFGFAGQDRYYADATGLDYLKARYYHSQVGRFISRDPIKDKMNWYAYVEDRPTMAVDPSGLHATIGRPVPSPEPPVFAPAPPGFFPSPVWDPDPAGFLPCMLPSRKAEFAYCAGDCLSQCSAGAPPGPRSLRELYIAGCTAACIAIQCIEWPSLGCCWREHMKRTRPGTWDDKIPLPLRPL